MCFSCVRNSPVILSKSEVAEVLNNLEGTHWLIRMLIYGAGLRLSEELQLRIKDIDFTYNQIFVRDSKGVKDRTTMLPHKVAPSLRKHLNIVEKYIRRI